MHSNLPNEMLLGTDSPEAPKELPPCDLLRLHYTWEDAFN